MNSFSTFSFHSFSFDYKHLQAKFTYAFDDQLFTEMINFSTPVKKIRLNIDETIINNILKHIHIAVWISYYKLSPTAEILVPDRRTAKMLTFRKKFYLNGLGELMFVNGLSPSCCASFSPANNPSVPAGHLPWQGGKYDDYSPDRGMSEGQGVINNQLNDVATGTGGKLLFFWGWKDSLVSVELLKQQHQPFTLRSMGDLPLHTLAASKVDAPRIIQTRQLDPKLFEMNASGKRYNGHVPITGILSFISLLTAYLYEFDEIILSNEKSANIGNTTLDGVEINHQWSKSEDFEKAFQNYIKNLHLPIRYYSLLRQRDELRIVEEFCKYPQYFHSFSSCNRNFHLRGPQLSSDQLRCGQCPKCAFVYTMMRTFLPAETVNDIFHKNLFTDETLLPLFRELLGIEGTKPFECVGTKEEMLEALRLINKRWFQEGEGKIRQLLHLHISQKII